MSTFFALLYAAAFIVFIIFIIKSGKKKKRGEDNSLDKKIWIISLAVFVVSFILTGVTNTSNSAKKEEPAVASKPAVEKSKEEPTPTPAPTDTPDPEDSKKEEPTPTPTPVEKPAEEDTSEPSANDFVEAYSTDFVVGAKMTLDRYIADYKISLVPSNWTIAKFDDTDTLIGSTEITWQGRKGKFYFVGTLNFKGDDVEGVTPHYISVMDEVLGDDGYCDDVFGKINALGQ